MWCVDRINTSWVPSNNARIPSNFSEMRKSCDWCISAFHLCANMSFDAEKSFFLRLLDLARSQLARLWTVGEKTTLQSPGLIQTHARL